MTPPRPKPTATSASPTRAAPVGPKPSGKPARNTAVNPTGKAVAPPKGPAKGSATLAVLRDGEPIDDDSARELWDLFSRHMDEASAAAEGRFDALAAMDAFAAELGFATARPTHDRGRAVLQLSSVRPSR